MTDETLAATPDDTMTPINDGIIDLDAPVTAETPVGDGEETPATPEEPKPEGEKKPSGAQRAKIREARLLAELNEAQRKLEEVSRSTPAAKASESEDKPPREEDYNGDFFAYQRALTAHDAGKASREAIRKEFDTREQSTRQTQQAEIARERAVEHAERVEDARKTIADYQEVMDTMKNVNVRQGIIDEILSCTDDDGKPGSAVIAYFLAKNPDKLQAMDRMSGRELAREMGRLEATVQLPSAKKQTTAPAPLSALKGGASPSSAEGDLAKWMAKTYPKN